MSFVIEPDWLPENCEFVIFLQEHGTKEVLNATKVDLMEFTNINDYDASLSHVSNVPEKSCTGSFAPSVVLRNNGNEDLTSLTMYYQVNEGSLETFDWTGTLAFFEEETVELPLIYFTPAEENELKIYSEDPNGHADQYPQNDTTIQLIPEADLTPSTVTLFFRCDNNPEETTWKLLDSEGIVVSEGGPYSTPGYTFTEEFELDDFSCYQFYVYDEGGNGLSSPGFFVLYYGSNNNIIQGIGDFGASIGTDFSTDNGTGIGDIEMNAEVDVYPNPFGDYTNISFTTTESSQIRVKMFNAFAELVYQSDKGVQDSGKQLIKIDGKDFENGVYFVQLFVNEHVYIKKVSVAH